MCPRSNTISYRGLQGRNGHTGASSVEVPHVSIVIVNWNGEGVLETCLSSLARTGYPSFNIMVVDNGSANGSAGMARKKFPNVILIENCENVGSSRANYQGMRLALRDGANYLLLLNNDTQVGEEDWLIRMVELGEAESKVGVIGPRLIYPDGSLQISAHTISPIGFWLTHLDSEKAEQWKSIAY
jgi:GT2 family glycosyltransferase